MNILIVDDSPEKIAKIKDAISTVGEEFFTLHIAGNNAEAVQKLNTCHPDLMILDLNLPIRYGESSKKNAGLTLLNDIIRNPAIFKPISIIGLTAHEHIKKEYQERFNREGWIIESFDAKYTDWEETLKNKINYLKTMKLSSKNNVIVIFSALGKEFAAIRKHITNVEVERHPNTGTIYEVGNFESWKVVLMETGVGNIISGVEAERAINLYNPAYVFFAGVGGGLKDVKLGDVVIGTKIYYYESGKNGDTFLPRPNVKESSYALEQIGKLMSRDAVWLEKLNQEINLEKKYTPNITCYAGPIASGEKVIASTNSITFNTIKSSFGDSLVVAMEEYGILEACKAYPAITTVIVRGVSDLVDDKENADRAGYQEFASSVAANVVFEIINRISNLN